MNIVKKFIKPIICAVMLVALLFPYGEVVSTMIVGGVAGVPLPAQPVNGFSIFKGGIFGYLIIVLMAGICAADYIKAVKKFSPIIGGVGGLLIAVCAYLAGCGITSPAAEAMPNTGGAVEFENEFSIGFGFIAFAALAVVLAVISFVIKNNDAPAQTATPNFANFANGVQNRVANMRPQTAEAGVNAPVAPGQPAAAPVQRGVNRGGAAQMNEVEAKIGLVTKFFEMKERGILTEEEFIEQKKKILGSINL